MSRSIYKQYLPEKNLLCGLQSSQCCVSDFVFTLYGEALWTATGREHSIPQAHLQEAGESLGNGKKPRNLIVSKSSSFLHLLRIRINY